MSERFGPAFFRQNRETLRHLFTGKAPIVLTAHGVLQSGADMTFPFRQDRNFWYVTGIDEPDAILVIDKAKDYIILSEDHSHRAKFDGALSPAEILAISNVDEVLEHKAGWEQLKKRLKKVKHVATLAASPAYVPYYGFYTNPARARLIKAIKEINPVMDTLDLKEHFATMRMIKQPPELEAIQYAIRITSKVIRSVTNKAWAAATTESQLDNELLYQFRKQGADGLAFDNVVATGMHTATIHHRSGSTSLAKQQLLLLDVGAEVDHYAADISRVFALGRPSKRLRQIYEYTVEALNEALTLLAPGLAYSQFEKEMEHIVGEKLRALGLISVIDKESVRKYFPTFTAHHLGLDAHDASSLEKAFEPNMVLAVEPGIYIPEEGIGIRVEENVRITAQGNEVLTARLSRELKSLTIQ